MKAHAAAYTHRSRSSSNPPHIHQRSTHHHQNNPLPPNLTHPSPVTTHTVVAGRGGLRFDPDNIVATPGSVIEFHFLSANHSVVEAAFDAPCLPKDATSFDSGFFPVAASPDGGVQQSGEVFQFVVRDERPVWFYCAQGGHFLSDVLMFAD
ncbi:hypothetical protein B0I37DRAFT_417558 [Chaetomium sp. MPI-CAGE-AT-0009]|nr:hypothetical protein B0I37DRAFT_417558 [Chaetomium sp. MPI-CAGE-AT-0009]